ncbi:probable UDP-sugar transporter protein SLC35A4 [Gigantopelta aegis]|uniref:probable UDP-sugar transporter protein SLC35A4 n=1 Tax=Gigantopelta aegis TaxID=1735272 RepID=UPI001B88C2AB|nr:probable UDP-sugar transporter protein SLC35A4 [Gigantopelta aegis]
MFLKDKKPSGVGESVLPCKSQTADICTTTKSNDVLWYFMLCVEVVIYSSYTILVHLCEVDGKIPFSSSSMVLCIEVLKIVISVVLYTPHVRVHGLQLPPVSYCLLFTLPIVISVVLYTPHVRVHGLQLPPVSYCLLFTVPALLYCINNNIAVHMQVDMDPTTYQVLSNLKIGTTAVLYRIVIKRKLSSMQWFALCLLTVAGILDSYGGIHSREGKSAGEIHLTIRGLIMISIYCIISGLSGVYTEYVLKANFQTSLHLQNILLYVFGIILNGTVWLLQTSTNPDSDEPYDLFKGFSLYTWVIIITQACNGLIMSVIMKYRSNITRLFIISCAMLLTTLMSVIIFNLKLNVFFITAFILIIVALFLYNMS